MNFLDKQRVVNNNKRMFLDMMSVQHTNVVSMNPSNSLKHEMKKAELCYDLLKNGEIFVTEQKLKSPLSGRPDILVLSSVNPVAIEIVCTEKEESLMRKKKNYSINIQIVVVRV